MTLEKIFIKILKGIEIFFLISLGCFATLIIEYGINPYFIIFSIIIGISILIIKLLISNIKYNIFEYEINPDEGFYDFEK